MCGIAGELRFHDPLSGADWGKISNMMIRRGPDDSGIWAEDDCCTLVFRRLSILDLSPAGHQPMASQDGRFVLTFNGEVYNFKAIRHQLEAKGRRFRSSGDTEVVLQALIEWGTGALEKFNGMFALAFYDSLERHLLLARDHAGIKPLYYMDTPKGVVFASQYDQLLRHPWSRNLGVSSDALALYLRLAYIPSPYAILQDTYMLGPGAWLEIDNNGKIRQGQYFSFPSYEEPSLRGDEAVDAVDAAVAEAVQRQLVSDVPLGAFLSGGIDSPLVVAKMLGAGTGKVQAFTIGTGDDATDESPDAIIYARELGVDHTIENATPDQGLDMLGNVISACGEPFGDYSIFPTMLVSQLASRSYKVMVSGDGGDELFWGYAGRSSTLIGASEKFKPAHILRILAWGQKKLLGTGSGNHFARRYPELGDWQRDRHTHLREKFLGRIFPKAPAWPSGFQGYKFSGWERNQTAQWLRWNEFVYHLPMVLQKVDRASMHHSLEVRVPLLDREVVDTAARVDWSTCLDLENKRGKLPLRLCHARHFRHQTQAKRGFEVPMGKWLRTSLQDVFKENVLARNEILGMEIDKKGLSELFNLHLNQTHDLARGLWPILSLSLWERHHYLKRS